MTKLKGLIDTPISSTNEDNLGLAPYVKSLCTIIENCDTPMTVSIQGDWGTGKTSFMELMKENIRNQNQSSYKIIDFNTWQYSKFNMDDMLSILFLDKFAKSIIDMDKDNDNKELRRTLSKLAALGLNIWSRGSISIDPEVCEKFNSNENILDFATHISNLKNQLQQEINSLVDQEDEINRIIIFIDDLDRLHPSKAVDLLEILQLFLTLEHCIFVLAVDYEVIIQGIKYKYGDQYTDIKAKNFFDKIIQLPFSIPVGSNDKIEDYVNSCVTSISNEELRKETLEDFVILINDSVQFNPRNIKRIFNAYWLLTLVISEKSETNKFNKEDVSLALFAVLCMQLAYEPVYNQIVKSIDDIDNLKKLLDNKKETINNIKNNDHINNKAINWDLCLSFLESFEMIFNLNDEIKVTLLAYVLDLSQSTSVEGPIQNTNKIDSIVIHSIETKQINKLKILLQDNYQYLIFEPYLINYENSSSYIIPFKEKIDKSIQQKIKGLLINNNISHTKVTSRKYNYENKKDSFIPVK